MAVLTFTFETGAVPLTRIVDAVALLHGYSALVPDPNATPPNSTSMPNPQTKAQFAKGVIRGFLINAVKEAELRVARTSAESGVVSIDLT